MSVAAKIAALPLPGLDLFLPTVDPSVQVLHDHTGVFTTSAAVRDVVDLANWPACGGKALEAGCGNGNFLVELVARLDLPPGDVEALAARVEGWEIHPVAADEARARLAAHLVARGWADAAARAGAERVVIVADFLVDGPLPNDKRGAFRVAVGNPPYCLMARVPADLRAKYERVVPAHARADLLPAFLDRVVAVLADDGVLAMVTSDRWLFNESCAQLREIIGARFGIKRVKRLDPGSAFERSKQRRVGSPARVHPVAVCLAPVTEGHRALGRAPVYPGEGEEAAPAAGTVRLGACAEVKLAPWLGPHGIHTIDLADAVAMGLPPEAYVPCVDTDDIRDGVVQAPTRVALRVRRDAEPAPAVREHLARENHRMPRTKRRDVGAKNWWLPPESWGAFPLAEEALLIPRIARGVRTVRLPAGVLPINHNLTVVRAKGEGAPDLDTLDAALTSEAVQAWVRRAPRLENGYRSLTTKLLRDAPLPLPGLAGGAGEGGAPSAGETHASQPRDVPAAVADLPLFAAA